MNYFKLVMANEKRWHLAIKRKFSDGSPVDIWAYMHCQHIDRPVPVPYGVQYTGEVVDYNPTAFGSIVVSTRMAELVERVAPGDVQRIPASVEAEGSWEVLNILNCLDCIDHDRSIIQYYPDDHEEKPGKPRGVMKLRLDRSRVGDHHVFRPHDWIVAEVVSETVKNLLEENGITGIEYWPVTD